MEDPAPEMAKLIRDCWITGLDSDACIIKEMKARRTDLVIETRVRTECFVEALQDLGDVVWVATRKGSGHDVPVHHHRAHLPLVQPQRIQHPLPPAEHGRGAKGHHG